MDSGLMCSSQNGRKSEVTELSLKFQYTISPLMLQWMINRFVRMKTETHPRELQHERDICKMSKESNDSFIYGGLSCAHARGFGQDRREGLGPV